MPTLNPKLAGRGSVGPQPASTIVNYWPNQRGKEIRSSAILQIVAGCPSFWWQQLLWCRPVLVMIPTQLIKWKTRFMTKWPAESTLNRQNISKHMQHQKNVWDICCGIMEATYFNCFCCDVCSVPCLGFFHVCLCSLYTCHVPHRSIPVFSL